MEDIILCIHGMFSIPYMLDECLYYLVAVRHVCDHVFHIVLWRPNQRRPKH